MVSGARHLVDRDGAGSVVLVSMPFAGRLQASLALSSLGATLAHDPIEVHIRYFGLRFADLLAARPYDRVSDGAPFSRALAGEWVFAGAVFGGSRMTAAEYARAVSVSEDPASEYRSNGTGSFDDELIEFMESAAGLVDGFLDGCCDEVVALRPAVVGFTSMFQQQLASLGLARRIKAASPDTTIVFGGANCDGPMGRQLVDSFDWVDAAVIGEAEIAFPLLVRRVLAGESFHGIRGVQRRGTSALSLGAPISTDPIRDLDDLPVPDQSGYFAQFAASRHGGRPRVLFEASRGCWWGERRHCTFCGLNPETMGYRSKSATRVIEELRELVRAHPGLPVAAVDNILDRDYFTDLLPTLASAGGELDLFFEVKANLTREQVRQLRDAGIRNIQPGIESLSSAVLRQMHKGVTALQNIQLLKWCIEFGVHPTWNVLWGFPGEDAAEYETMAEVVPSLTHLTPPLCAGPVRLDRFSPLFEHAVADPSVRVGPAAAYPLLYDLPDHEVWNLAYFFHIDPPAGVAGYTAGLRTAIARWAEEHPRSALFFFDTADEVTIWDCRGGSAVPTRLRGPERALYLELGRVRSTRALGALFGAGDHGSLTDVLTALGEGRLIASMGDAHVALAVEVGDYRPPMWTLPLLFAALSTEGASSRLAIGEKAASGSSASGTRSTTGSHTA